MGYSFRGPPNMELSGLAGQPVGEAPSQAHPLRSGKSIASSAPTGVRQSRRVLPYRYGLLCHFLMHSLPLDVTPSLPLDPLKARNLTILDLHSRRGDVQSASKLPRPTPSNGPLPRRTGATSPSRSLHAYSVVCHLPSRRIEARPAAGSTSSPPRTPDSAGTTRPLAPSRPLPR